MRSKQAEIQMAVRIWLSWGLAFFLSGTCAWGQILGGQGFRGHGFQGGPLLGGHKAFRPAPFHGQGFFPKHHFHPRFLGRNFQHRDLLGFRFGLSPFAHNLRYGSDFGYSVQGPVRMYNPSYYGIFGTSPYFYPPYGGPYFGYGFYSYPYAYDPRFNTYTLAYPAPYTYAPYPLDQGRYDRHEQDYSRYPDESRSPEPSAPGEKPPEAARGRKPQGEKPEGEASLPERLDPRDVHLTLDGETSPSSPPGRPLTLGSGRHTLVVSAGSSKPVPITPPKARPN